MKLLVGGPVYHSAWVLPLWFEHVFEACRVAKIDPEFIFAGDPESDVDTWDAIDECAGAATVNPVFLNERDMPGSLPEDKAEHRWPQLRLHHITAVRNEVLAGVRELEPDMFLSLDSDILLHPDAVANLVETLRTTPAGAVGGKAYLGRVSNRAVTYGMLNGGGGLERQDAHGVFKVDVVMAVVLMSPAAYEVNYHHEQRGEDVGWSLACKSHGVKLWWDGRVPNKHVWSPDVLGLADARCGW